MPTVSFQELEAAADMAYSFMMSRGGFPSKRTRPHDPEKAALLIQARVAWISKDPGIVRDENGQWHLALDSCKSDRLNDGNTANMEEFDDQG